MIKQILRKNKLSLFFIYGYLTIYECLTLLTPMILGKAIDGLLDKNFLYIFFLFLIEFIANIFMYKRMVYDTIVYTRIYNEMVFDYLSKDGNDVSEQCAHTDLAGTIIHFFEDAIPYYIMSIISIFGSLFFIFYTNLITGFIVLSCLVPIILLVLYLYPKIATVTTLANTHFEGKIKALDNNEYVSYFNRRKKLQIYRSTLQGKSWFSLNNTKTTFLVIALVSFTYNNNNLTQGEVISMYAYINQFLVSLMSIPIAMEIYSMVKDVSKRMS